MPKSSFAFPSAVRVSLALLGGAFLVPTFVSAQTSGTWISNTAGGNWSDSTQWTSGIIPNGTGSTATFTTNTAGNSGKIVTLDEAVILGNLSLLETGTSTAAYGGWQISGDDLTMATGNSTLPAIYITGSNSSNVINSVIHGTQGLSITGGGNLYLTGNNDYSGATIISNGHVFLESNNALGATGSGNGTTLDNASTYPQLHILNNITSGEDFTLSDRLSSATAGASVGATFIFNDSGNNTIAGNISLARTAASTNGQNNVDYFELQSSSGILAITGNISGTLTAGYISSGAASTATGVQASGTYSNPNLLILKTSVASAIVDIAGTISNGAIGTGGISVETDAASTGTVILSGANTYTGSTIHQAGTLLVNNTTGSGTGYGSVTVASGAILGGTGIIAPTGTNGVTFASGSIVYPGTIDSNGTHTSAGETLTFNLANTTGSVTFASGASIALGLNGSDAATAPSTTQSLSFVGLTSGSSQVIFNDNVVSFTVTGSALAAGTYVIASFDQNNAYTGNLVLGDGLSGNNVTAQLVETANSIELVITSAIPEPATTAAILGALAIGFVFLVRRRRR